MSIVLALQNSISGALAAHIDDLGNTAAESAQAKAVKDVANSLSATKKSIVAEVERRIRMQLKKDARAEKHERKEQDRLDVAKILLDISHEFACCFISSRGDVCGADAFKIVVGLEVDGFPYKPKCCTRHFNILSRSDKTETFEVLEGKLNWIGALAQQLQKDADMHSAQPKQGPTVEEVPSEGVSDESGNSTPKSNQSDHMDTD